MTTEAALDADAYLALVRRRDSFCRVLGIEIVAAAPGRATARLLVGGDHLNFFGVAHGGVVFSLADTAFGVAANAAGRIAAMVDAHLTMTDGVAQGDVLTATAEEASRSRRLAVYRCDVVRRREGEERTIATFTGTVYRTDRQLEV